MVHSTIQYTVEFDSLESAQRYGTEIDSIAIMDSAKVAAGKSGKPKSIFRDRIGGMPNAETIGEYHFIYKVQQPNSNKVTYEVGYAISTPRGVKRADVLQATRYIDAHLNEKLQELGGRNITGLSR